MKKPRLIQVGFLWMWYTGKGVWIMKLGPSFFQRPCLEVAEDLVGKILVHRVEDTVLCARILETEAYCGTDDTACHVHKGRTKRTEVFYCNGGTAYVYLCYGIHWMLNVVTGHREQPEAVLIRACQGAEGPGRLTKYLQIDGSFNGSTIADGNCLWIEDDGKRYSVRRARRVGIGYASEQDQARLWRFILDQER